MSERFKKLLSILLIVILAVGWIAFVNGIGGNKPLINKIPLGLDINGGVSVVMEAKTNLEGTELRELMNQTKEVINRRVDQMGIANADVRVEGTKRIRVELPGVKNAEEAISQIGKTAQLKFTMADGGFVLDGSSVKNATIGQAQQGGYAVNLEFKADGAKAFEEATKKAMTGSVKANIKGEGGQVVGSRAIVIWLDNEVISSPNVQSVISGGKCEITGHFTQEEAKQLAALIRGGALPAPLTEVESGAQSAEIGLTAFNDAVKAGIIGAVLIFIVMIIAYRMMGVIADLALAMYILIILAVMAFAGSVLTLPGIAGIILSIGMAVDANVVIFSRIKEEIISGKSPRVAVGTGFKRAMATVIDSQLTTLIAAVILYQIGTSGVKGFAWTLMIGILASLLTAVVVTQLYLTILANTKRYSNKQYYGIKADGTASFTLKKQFEILKHRKLYYIVSILVIVVGIGFAGIKGFNYGIDFTGGTMIQMDMGKEVPTNEINDLLQKRNIKATIVYSGSDRNSVIIKTPKALETKERYAVIDDIEKTFNLDSTALKGQGFFGPTVGRELKTNALKAVLLASLGMLVYIRFRFKEWKFGAAALIGVAHDVLWVITFYAVFGITVNNPFIAGILTVVGYSINDTIVIFDRIRENNRFSKKNELVETIDTSINQTLGRSIMTSATTLIVMIPLFFMATESLKEFVLPLMAGVGVGCLSSIFVCSPIYYELVNYTNKSKYEKLVLESQKKKNKGNKK